MRRLLASAGVLLFVAATIAVPAAHRLALAQESPGAHCPCSGSVQYPPADHQDPAPADGHAGDDCPICKLAQTPLDTAPTLASTGVIRTDSVLGDPVQTRPSLRASYRLPFSRGPPRRSSS